MHTCILEDFWRALMGVCEGRDIHLQSNKRQAKRRVSIMWEAMYAWFWNRGCSCLMTILNIRILRFDGIIQNIDDWSACIWEGKGVGVNMNMNRNCEHWQRNRAPHSAKTSGPDFQNRQACMEDSTGLRHYIFIVSALNWLNWLHVDFTGLRKWKL